MTLKRDTCTLCGSQKAKRQSLLWQCHQQDRFARGKHTRPLLQKEHSDKEYQASAEAQSPALFTEMLVEVSFDTMRRRASRPPRQAPLLASLHQLFQSN